MAPSALAGARNNLWPKITVKTGSWIITENAATPCATLPLSDRGFRFGMHFFETLGVHNGKGVFIQEHLDLLRECCGKAGFEVPETAWRQLTGFLARDWAGDGILRVHVTAGDGAPSDPPGECRIFVRAETVAGGAGGPSAGLRLAFLTIAPDPWGAGWKSGNYWRRIDLLRQAREAGCDEALLFDRRGNCLGACMANFFYLLKGDPVTHTPPATRGIRPGVVRRWLLDGKHADERPLHRGELDRVRYCFLTNSRIGIAGVLQLGEAKLTAGGKVKALAGLYNRLVKSG